MLRLILIEEDKRKGEVLARRLRAQGYVVEHMTSSLQAANHALTEPPNAIIADLWMAEISGIQLCRLLHAEPSTTDVPVILRASSDAARNRFWAERAGAAGYVIKGRMGELVRLLSRVVRPRDEETFFTQLPDSDIDIRDRLATYLDEALFSSVLAAEVRALSTCGSFERLFDLFCQLVCQVTTYRWLAVISCAPKALGIHTNPASGSNSLSELPQDVSVPQNVILIEDEDATLAEPVDPPMRAPIYFGALKLGEMLLSTPQANHHDEELVKLLAREMSGPLRIVGLVEESQRRASTDVLTGLLNRRALQYRLQTLSRTPETKLVAMLMDIDHFKQINDTYGHAAGDLLLGAIGNLLQEYALAARWGGEEFLLVFKDQALATASEIGERLLARLRELKLTTEDGEVISATASLGIAALRSEESFEKLIDRADRAMYHAKASGRDRAVTEELIAAPHLQAS